MPDDTPLRRILIAGGSIGGLCAGAALLKEGHQIDIFERVPGPMTSRGAGIVVQPELTALLREIHAPPLPMTGCRFRRYLEPDVTESGQSAMPQRFTSWEAIYRTLRASFPDDHYHLASTLTGFEQHDSTVTAHFRERDPINADLLVCADGSRSKTRERLLPDTKPRYAGYVAWRGTLDEQKAPSELTEFFDENFTFCNARSGGHALCYFIPGPGASTQIGRRRLNWVWYVLAGERNELKRWLVDRDGQHRHGSLGPGMVPDETVAEVHAMAVRELHTRFVQLVQATPDPFLQSIIDISVPRMAFDRVCLLGDAGFVVRPHTAAAAAKAAAEASTLASSLRAIPQSVPEALRRWETRQIQIGRDLVRYGESLGNRWASTH